MANVAVTCIKNGRSDSFGRPLVSGTYYPSVEIETAKALWNSGYVSVADASVFDQDPLAGTSPLDDFNVARALSLSRQPAQTSANLAAELAALGIPKAEHPEAANKPAVNLISDPQNGKFHHAFPSAARYAGNDYIIYREGNGHLESATITNTSRLVVAKRDILKRQKTSVTTISNPSGVDPRAGGILRDSYGNAILVGGMLKVLQTEYVGNYSMSNSRLSIADLNPADLGSGLQNIVLVPSTAVAAWSDFRQLSTGAYAFVGYSAANICYLVTTVDFVTFSTELIGLGNESALCETDDGMLNVIARGEENAGDNTTYFYKRPVAGGAWTLFDTLPFTLNAPTLIKANLTTVSGVPNACNGWFLLARDKTGRTGLAENTIPFSSLVSMWSKDQYGASITKFGSRKAICGSLREISGQGDAHYSSAICDSKTGDLSVYTYAPYITSDAIAATTFGVGMWYMRGVFTSEGVVLESINKRNAFLNGDFLQGGFAYDLPAANAVVSASALSGENVLVLTDAWSPSVQKYVTVVPGRTYFPKIRMRTSVANRADGQHFVWSVYDYSTGSAVLVHTLNPRLPVAGAFEGNWKVVHLVPFIAPSSKLLIVLSTFGGSTPSSSEVAEITLSDDYSADSFRHDIFPRIDLYTDATLAVSSGVGSRVATAGYSNGLWAFAFGLYKRSNGLPFPARTVADVSIRITNCTSNGLAVTTRTAVVNSDGSITGTFQIDSEEAGTFVSTILARIYLTITA